MPVDTCHALAASYRPMGKAGFGGNVLRDLRPFAPSDSGARKDAGARLDPDAPDAHRPMEASGPGVKKA